jgi:hypothetical protein
VGLGKVLTTPHHKNVYCYEIFKQTAAARVRYELDLVGVQEVRLGWVRLG